MRVSYNWLQSYFDETLPPPEEVARVITMHAYEVESVEAVGDLHNIVVGKILEKTKHPNADKLSVCQVDVGRETLEIVCGAPNVESGQIVPVALVGAKIPGGITIEQRELRGVLSHGMICSERELGISDAHEGILVLRTNAPLGTPVGEVLGLGTDFVLDIDVLPNRAHDSLSHNGIAREISVLFHVEAKPPSAVYKTDSSVKTVDRVSLVVESKNVRRAMKRLVTDVTIQPSPEWLAKRLQALGQRSINNIVDATNLVMLETGQPVHAFDFDKIRDGNITIRTAKNGERITLLDGEECTLNSEDLVIADGEKPLDIAGIKGGANSGIDDDTKNVVLSICNFDPVAIRKTSQRLGLKTEASKRFENEVTPELTTLATDRLSMFIAELASGKVAADVIDYYPNPVSKTEVSLSTGRVNVLLGTELSDTDIETIVKRLRFEHEVSGGTFTVAIPHERLDLRIEEDLVEEIGRIYGYENIAPVPIKEELTPEVNKTFYYVNKIRDVLVGEGFSEVYTYALVGNGDVELENPLASDKASMRRNLSEALSRVLSFNIKHRELLGKEAVNIFEIGNVFSKDSETLSLALASSGKDAVSALEKIGEELGIEISVDATSDCIELNLSELIKKLPEPESYKDIKRETDTVAAYRNFSQYPYIVRDIALWVPEQVSSSDVLNVVRENVGELAVNSYQFDEFTKDGKTSYAFRIVFQSMERTLTDEEVNKEMDRVYTAVKKEGWEVR